MGIGITDGNFSGSGITLSALSSIAKAHLVNNTQVVTLNGRIAPIQVGTEFGYIESTSTTVNNGTTQTTINPGTINSGLALQVLPQIQSNGNILLQTAISVADLERLDTFTAGDSIVQVPKRALRNIVQAAAMKSGQTLILSGFQAMASKIENNGVGSPYNLLFGGAQKASNTKEQLVFLITPYLMD